MPSLVRRLSLAATFALALAGPSVAQESLTLAWSPAAQMPQIDVAIAEGLFEDAGLDVSIVTFASGREAFEALTGGQADLATMAELPAVTGALRGQDFAVIADLARYEGSRIVTDAASGIEAPEDLAGRRVGVTLGTNTDFFIGKVLADAGVTAELVNAAPSDLLPALINGDVDAIVPFPNVYPAARRALGDGYREMASNLYEPHYVLAASRQALDDRTEALALFLGAMVRAEAFVTDNPDSAAEAVVATVQGNIDANAVRGIWKETDIGTQLDAGLLDLMAEQGAWIVGRGVINAETPTPQTLRPFLDPAPLASIDPAAVSVD